MVCISAVSYDSDICMVDKNIILYFIKWVMRKLGINCLILSLPAKLGIPSLRCAILSLHKCMKCGCFHSTSAEAFGYSIFERNFE